MQSTMGELIVITAVFLLLAFPLYLAVGGPRERDIPPPVLLSELKANSKLSGFGKWQVTILRRSGYVHDAWAFDGSAFDALNSAEGKMAQAGLNEFLIRANSLNKFEVRAYYESTGKRRTGKYIGGFTITRA